MSYRLGGALSGLAIGGNLYWQSAIHYISSWPVVGTRARAPMRSSA